MGTDMLQAQYEASTSDIIEWLESPEGEIWSRVHHPPSSDRLFLLSVKEDRPAEKFEVCPYNQVAILWHV